jgi:hypothetical protein
MLFTGASAIAAVNSMLGGVGLALLVGRVDRVPGVVVVSVGILAAVVLFGLHVLYQRRRSARGELGTSGSPL